LVAAVGTGGDGGGGAGVASGAGAGAGGVTLARAQIRSRMTSFPSRSALMKKAAGNVTELTSSTMDQVTVNLGAPGAYRIEISIIPRHLGPYLGDLGTDMADAEMPWIYVSPFYVQ